MKWLVAAGLLGGAAILLYYVRPVTIEVETDEPWLTLAVGPRGTMLPDPYLESILHG